jgi:diketogulonate reductase-like aldo/keto reductase
MNYIELNTKAKMPMLGLGVYQAVGEGEVEGAIANALEAGYRLIDTAAVYKNEDGVGRAIKQCSIPREEIFVTTKVWNNAQRRGDIVGAFERSLERLDMDYVDLFLVHWPVKECYLDTYKELEKIYATGRAKAIGVSNFLIHHLESLFEVSGVIPAVNQFEFHPLCTQLELVKYCQEKNIAVQAYTPIVRNQLADNQLLGEIAAKYGKEVNQVILRWDIEHGVATIPKSVNPSRIKSNIDIFDFELTKEEILAIDSLDQEYRTAGHPDTFDF